MTSQQRKNLNHDIRSLAHGKLGLNEPTYRQIVDSISGKEHITECSDEEANLVMLALRKMRDNVGTGTPVKKNPDQHRFIARLMDYLKWNWKNTGDFCLKITGKHSTKGCNAAELSKIIRGMISIIDHDIAQGKIILSHTEKFEYDRYTKHQRPASEQTATKIHLN